MQRKTISLNGAWEVVFDDRESLKADCFQRGAKSVAVNVPGVWEEARPGYDGQGFYRRKFDVPAGMVGRQLHLKFWAVNYFAEVFLNGRKAGEHEGGYTPFELNVTGLVLAEGNELVVRVINPPRTRTVQGFRTGAPLSNSDLPTWKAGWYYNFGGIWQPVELYATAAAFVEDVFVQPQEDLKTVKFDVTVVNRGAAGKYMLTLALAPRTGREKTGLAAERAVRLKKGLNHFRFTETVKRPHLWSPDDPFLYTTTVTVSRAGAAVDALAVKCGLRYFTIDEGVFKLNGRRIALRGFLQQGVYPRHLVFPESLAEARRELMLLKKAGMNFVRAHLKPPPIHLDLADELGILLLEEPSIGWIQNTPQAPERSRREVDELVRRDRNRPSVVMWGILNEAVNYRSFTPPELLKFKNALSEQLRELDQTRLVIDNSGGELNSHGGPIHVHLPFRKEMALLYDLHAYCFTPVTSEAFETYRGHADGDKLRSDGKLFQSVSKKVRRGRNPTLPPVFVSEFGAFEGPPDYEKVLGRYSAADKRLGLEDYAQQQRYYDSLKEVFKTAGLARTFGTMRNFLRLCQEYHCENARSIVSSMRSNPRNSGWAYCQLADASGEIFGATDIWRQPRLWFKDMVAASATPLVVPHTSARVVAPGDPLGLDLRIVNEDRQGQDWNWKVAIVDEQGRTVAREQGRMRSRAWVQEVLATEIRAPRRGGRYRVEAELRDGRRLLSTNYIRFSVIERPQVPVPRVGLLDAANELRPALEDLGIPIIDRAVNSYSLKENPCILVARAEQHGGVLSEMFRRTRQLVETGGTVLVLEPVTPLLYDELLPKLIRLRAPMRDLIYMQPSPIWDGLPTTGGLMDYEFADLIPGRAMARNNAEDVRAAGGRTIAGSLWANMWTRPDYYQWNSFIDDIPVGRGHVIICQFGLVKLARTNIVAKRLLANLIRYTASLIKPGGEETLLRRCVDPMPWDRPAGGAGAAGRSKQV
jgi:hypothetical protein